MKSSLSRFTQAMNRLDDFEVIQTCVQLYKQQKYQECLTVLLSMMIQYDFNFNVFFLAANCLAQLGGITEASNLYNQILTMQISYQDRQLILESLIKLHFNEQQYDIVYQYAKQLAEISTNNPYTIIAQCQYKLINGFVTNALIAEIDECLGGLNGIDEKTQQVVPFLKFYNVLFTILLSKGNKAENKKLLQLFDDQPRLQRQLLQFYSVYTNVYNRESFDNENQSNKQLVSGAQSRNILRQYIIEQKLSLRFLIIYQAKLYSQREKLRDKRNDLQGQHRKVGDQMKHGQNSGRDTKFETQQLGELNQQISDLQVEITQLDQQISQLSQKDLKYPETALQIVSDDLMALFYAFGPNGKQIANDLMLFKALNNIVDEHIKAFYSTTNQAQVRGKFFQFAQICYKYQAFEWKIHYLYKYLDAIYHNIAIILYRKLQQLKVRDLGDEQEVFSEINELLISALYISLAKSSNPQAQIFEYKSWTDIINDSKLLNLLLIPNTGNLETLMLYSQLHNNFYLSLNLYLNALDIKNTNTNKTRYQINCIQLLHKEILSLMSTDKSDQDKIAQYNTLLQNLLLRRKDVKLFIAKASVRELTIYQQMCMKNHEFQLQNEIFQQTYDNRFLGHDNETQVDIMKALIIANKIQFLNAQKIKAKIFGKQFKDDIVYPLNQGSMNKTSAIKYLDDQIDDQSQQVLKYIYKIFNKNSSLNSESLINVFLALGQCIIVQKFYEDDQFQLLQNIYLQIQFSEKKIQEQCLFLMCKASAFFQQLKTQVQYTISYLTVKYGLQRYESTIQDLNNHLKQLQQDSVAFDLDTIIVLQILQGLIIKQKAERQQGAVEALCISLELIINNNRANDFPGIIKYNIHNVQKYIRALSLDESLKERVQVNTSVLELPIYLYEYQELQELNKKLPNAELTFQSKAVKKIIGPQDISDDVAIKNIDLFTELLGMYLVTK